MKMKFALPATILAAGLLATTASYAKPEYTKKEKKGCVFCHVSAKSKELNDAGKYYQEKKTLEGYKAPQK
ncbi:MAG: hypothetical protein IT158_11770 [Bryobacterales bacterium]|nr:hypothetical protein [Bryobacterales bacterium]